MPQDDSPADEDLGEIYRLLERGEGHERVTDENVQALLSQARARGDSLIATLLQEWQSPCSPANPPDPPTPNAT